MLVVVDTLRADLNGDLRMAASTPKDVVPQLEGEMLERLRSLAYVR